MLTPEEWNMGLERIAPLKTTEAGIHNLYVERMIRQIHPWHFAKCLNEEDPSEGFARLYQRGLNHNLLLTKIKKIPFPFPLPVNATLPFTTKGKHLSFGNMLEYLIFVPAQIHYEMYRREHRGVNSIMDITSHLERVQMLARLFMLGAVARKNKEISGVSTSLIREGFPTVTLAFGILHGSRKHPVRESVLEWRMGFPQDVQAYNAWKSQSAPWHGSLPQWDLLTGD